MFPGHPHSKRADCQRISPLRRSCLPSLDKLACLPLISDETFLFRLSINYKFKYQSSSPCLGDISPEWISPPCTSGLALRRWPMISIFRTYIHPKILLHLAQYKSLTVCMPVIIFFSWASPCLTLILHTCTNVHFIEKKCFSCLADERLGLAMNLLLIWVSEEQSDVCCSSGRHRYCFLRGTLGILWALQ